MEKVTHLGVYGVLRKDDKILLIKKARGPYAGKFDLPGGKLEHGENIEQALRREILEETGVQVDKIAWLQNMSTLVEFADDRGEISMYHVGLIYKVVGFDDSNLDQNINEKDSLGANWYMISDLDPDQMSPFAQSVIESHIS